MAFFPELDSRFTQTPNVFYDEIMFADGATFNEVKLVGYLIRKTLGYNKKEAWVKVSRKDLVDKAKISYGSIKPTVDSCIAKKWLLEFKTGPEGKEERYVFLNTKTNNRIVQGLKKGYFTIQDLKLLNDYGIEQLLEKHGILDEVEDLENENEHSRTKNEQGTRSEIEQGNSCTRSEVEQGDVQNLNGGCSAVEQGTRSEIEQVDKPQTQAAQGVPAPLNTSFKDNIYKDKDINTDADEATQLWNQLLESIQSKISKPSYDTWLKDTKATNYENNVITVVAQSDFHRDWLASRYMNIVQNTLLEVTRKNIEVKFVCEEMVGV